MNTSKNKIIKSTSAMLLIVLSLLFIHSELGVGMSNEEGHEQHDFCDIVSFSSTLLKDKQNSDTTFHVAVDHPPIRSLTVIERPAKISIDYNFTPFTTTSLKLSSLQSFLI